MLKLMKLEIKKFKFGKTIKGVIIANLIILGFMIMISFATQNDKDMTLSDYNHIFLFTGIIVRATFSIFSAVLISKLIIGEYKNKTINILFTYPINRKKIMIAKLSIVLIFALTTMIISNLFVNFSLFFINIFAPFIKESLTMDILLKNLTSIVTSSIAFAFVSLIPVYVGMMKKSDSATLVTSIIIVSLLNSGNKGNNLGSIIIIPVILALVGAITAYLAIKDVEKVDVENF